MGVILDHMKFRATVELGGKTATGIEVPEKVVAALGSGSRPPVTVTVGGHSYRTTIARMGGRFLVPLSAENRTAAGVAAGDDVDVDIEPDTAPREVELPADLTEALTRDEAARATFLHPPQRMGALGGRGQEGRHPRGTSGQDRRGPEDGQAHALTEPAHGEPTGSGRETGALSGDTASGGRGGSKQRSHDLGL